MIGVILMVAITVVLAAAVYVWTNTFAGDDEGSESATLRTLSVDLDGDGRKDWIRVTLLKGENAPYPMDFVDWQITRADGTVASNSVLEPGTTVGEPDLKLCRTAVADGTYGVSARETDYECDTDQEVISWDCDTRAASTDPTDDCTEWTIGQTYFFPCSAIGEYRISVAVRGTALIDNRAQCEGTAEGIVVSS